VLASRSEGKWNGGDGGGRNGNGGDGCSGDGCSGGDMLETGESWSSVSPPPPLNNSASHRILTAQLVHLAGCVVEDGGEGAVAGSGSGRAGFDSNGGCDILL
jgi:hypothetical protein